MTYTAAGTDSLLETDFRIGVVVSKSVRVFLNNIVAFTLIASVVGLANIPLHTVDIRDSLDADRRIIALGCSVLHFVLWALASAVIFYATYQQMCGRGANVREAATRVLPRSLPLIGITFISVVGLFIAVLALTFLIMFSLIGATYFSPGTVAAPLVIPGVFLVVIWLVAGVACVVERLGVLRSLRRSRELTRGYRWRILALLLVSILATVIIAVLAASVQEETGIGMWGQIVVSLVWLGLSGGFNAVLIAVSYYYLRVAKEGGDGQQIAAVFD